MAHPDHTTASGRAPQASHPISRLYISNLAPTDTVEEVRALVERVAPVRRMTLLRNLRTGLCARFVFLDVAAEHEQAIRDRFEGATYHGRTLGVGRIFVRPDRSGPDGV